MERSEGGKWPLGRDGVGDREGEGGSRRGLVLFTLFDSSQCVELWVVGTSMTAPKSRNLLCICRW